MLKFADFVKEGSVEETLEDLNNKTLSWTPISGKALNPTKKGVMMALPIYITITIVLLHFAFHIRKPLNFLQNSLIFMVIAIFTRQCLTVMGLEWNLYKLTEDDWLFVCLLLCRDILTPMVTVIFCNFYLRRDFWLYRLATFVISLATLLGLNYMAVRFGIITYIKWNFGYTLLLNAIFLLAALGLMKLTLFIPMWEKRQNESI